MSRGQLRAHVSQFRPDGTLRCHRHLPLLARTFETLNFFTSLIVTFVYFNVALQACAYAKVFEVCDMFDAVMELRKHLFLFGD